MPQLASIDTSPGAGIKPDTACSNQRIIPPTNQHRAAPLSTSRFWHRGLSDGERVAAHRWLVLCADVLCRIIEAVFGPWLRCTGAEAITHPRLALKHAYPV